MSEPQPTAELAELLHRLKKRTGRSYEALAQRSGLSRSTVHRYCSGAAVPAQFETASQLARACGASREELLELHRRWAIASAAQAAPAPVGMQNGTPDADAGPPEPSAVPPDVGAVSPDAGAVSRDAGAVSRDAGGTDVDSGPQPDTGPEVGAGAAPAMPAGPADSGGGEPTAAPALAADAGSSAGEGAQGVPAAPPGSAGRRYRMLVAAAVLIGLVGVLGVAVADGFRQEVPLGPAAGEPLLFSDPCDEVVGMGQQDECVREVQRLLTSAGTTVDVDGMFGPQTRRKITAFQVLAGLPPRGVVDEATKQALYGGEVSMATWPAGQVERRIREVFPEQPDRAVRIADCQSLLDPLYVLPNTDGSLNWGVFQLSDRALRRYGGTPQQAFDPEWNIVTARRLWEEYRDFRHWPHCDRAAGPTGTPSGPAPTGAGG